jgi:primosomal protein N' (replication factor Y)
MGQNGEKMRYAEVSVNSPVAQQRTFSYRIPDSLSINVGQTVWVPFGERTLQGVVIELATCPAVAETRDIAGTIDSIPLLTPCQVSLARWLSGYYLAPLFEAVALMLPPGFARRVITYLGKSPHISEIPLSITPEQKEILELILAKESVSLKELESTFGRRQINRFLPQLLQQHLVLKRYELENPRVRPKIVSHICLKVKPEEAQKALESLGKKSVKQTDLLLFLIANPEPLSQKIAREKTGASLHTIQTLAGKGLIQILELRVDRDPLQTRNINLSFPLSLTSAQEKVFKVIRASLQKERPTPSRPDVFLLRGVTGSGKTEVYIQALEETVRTGKRGIVLVPEIAMTPQIIERFVSRFPGKVAVLHSELTIGEQFDEWWRIKKGEFDVVIGPRSAIFAPQPELGLIVIDEEHEWTYKQEDSPRYHTREAALKLAEFTGATVVLGSATPDVESYFRAVNGEFQLLELPERVTPDEGAPLPQVEIVDLKAELKAGNLSLFSRSLASSIDAALKNHEQILLFLNRRGAASFVECRNCGWVVRCKRCEVPLSYHFGEGTLVCHQCNYHLKAPQVCPRCKSLRIKYLGAGTEKLEQETAKAFPQARLLRWDSDIIRGRSHSHQYIYDKFRAGEADILIGTQMIAKGLDLPGVTLVGVVSADTALNLPDFRAGERTFQLLSQVAGRAGRGQAGGKVIIQTYSPEHYAIRAAASHDYLAFYEKELAYRRQLHNPPFSRLARLTFTHVNEIRCRQEVERIKKLILDERDQRGVADISLIGPAPAFIQRSRGRFRWQIIIRSPNPAVIISKIVFPRGWILDIDPVGLT